MPGAGSTPRRARYLIPRDLPRRGEVVAACAVAILVAHLLLAQLTLVLGLIFAVVGKATRWRRWWLLAPAGAGLAWTLAAGPETALAGFTAGPSSILWHLGGGHLAGRGGHPFAGFGGVRSWLPRQLPVALIAGAAEAGLLGWLDWLHTDEWAVPPPRPGLVAAARRAVAERAVRAGSVVTREGAALGVEPSTGALAELRWAEAAHGTLIVGAAAQDVALGGLQVVHAALRRRKPVIVLDQGDAAIARALDAACAATGVPLLALGSSGAGRAARSAAARVPATVGAGAVGATSAGASGLWGRAPAPERDPGDQGAGELGRVVRERSAALLPADTAELASHACAELVSLAGDLRRVGVDGDALVWVPCGEQAPAQALADLLRCGRDVGLAVMIGTTSPTAADELCGLTGSALIYRVAHQELAASLVTRTGTRLLPRPLAAALIGEGASTGLRSGVPGPGGPLYPGAAAQPTATAPAGAVAPMVELVPGPVIPARALLELGQAEFVLAVSRPRQRAITTGRMVPARLPPATDRRAGHRDGHRTVRRGGHRTGHRTGRGTGREGAQP